MNVLVGYASAHGSTAEIAEFIGKELAKRDFNVTVSNVADVQSLDGYDAFVLGSAIHAQMWLTEMSQFLERFRGKLTNMPVAFFITCIRVLEPDGYEHSLHDYVNHRILKQFHLKELTAFAGRLEMDAVDWNERWTLAARYDGAEPPGNYNQDFRNWQTIQAWSQKVADKFLFV